MIKLTVNYTGNSVIGGLELVIRQWGVRLMNETKTLTLVLLDIYDRDLTWSGKQLENINAPLQYLKCDRETRGWSGSCFSEIEMKVEIPELKLHQPAFPPTYR